MAAALHDAAQTLDELVLRVYDDTDPAIYPLAKRSLRAHLEKLKREGRARGEGEGWRLA